MALKRFQVLLEWDPRPGRWVAHVPVLNNLVAGGETRDEALERTREAILAFYEEAQRQGIRVDDISRQAELLEVVVRLPETQPTARPNP